MLPLSTFPLTLISMPLGATSGSVRSIFLGLYFLQYEEEQPPNLSVVYYRLRYWQWIEFILPSLWSN